MVPSFSGDFSGPTHSFSCWLRPLDMSPWLTLTLVKFTFQNENHYLGLQPVLPPMKGTTSMHRPSIPTHGPWSVLLPHTLESVQEFILLAMGCLLPEGKNHISWMSLPSPHLSKLSSLCPLAYCLSQALTISSFYDMRVSRQFSGPPYLATFSPFCSHSDR